MMITDALETWPLPEEGEESLTWRQHKILTLFREYARRRLVPSLRELTDGCGLSSTSVADYNVKALIKAGWLEESRVPGASRSVRLVEQPGEPCPYCGRHD